MDGREGELTVAEAAERAQVGPSSIRRWLRTGKLPGRRLGQRAGYRIQASDLERLVAERDKGRNGQRPAREPMTAAEPCVLEGSLPGGYALRAPVRVVLWQEGAEVVADAPDLHLHAFGNDAEAALTILGGRIVDQFTRLDEMGERLAPRMMRERDLLRRHLVLPRA